MSSRFVASAALVALVVQNTAVVLLLRYSRTIEGPQYYVSTAVVCGEFVKLIACLVITLYNAPSIYEFVREIRRECIEKRIEIARLFIPSLLYTLQNNLQYVALSNLDAVTCQLLYQLKILTTAVFSVIILGKSLSWGKWVALVILTIAVSVVQTSQASDASPTEKTNVLVGFIAVLCACVTSGFTGVYFEKILKGSDTSLWMRNIQLCIGSIPLALLLTFSQNGEDISTNGFFFGYNEIVWLVIALHALGGLIVAVVVKYADNILKGFAASYSIIASLVIQMVWFDFHPNSQFLFGALLVNVASYLYAKPDPPVAATLSSI